MKDEIGKPKFEYKSFEVDHEVYEEIVEKYKERMYLDVQAVDKEVRDETYHYRRQQNQAIRAPSQTYH